MPIDFACSSCGKKYRVPDAMSGKAVRCQDCSTVMKVPAAAGAAPGAPSSKAAPAKASPAKAPATPAPAKAADDPFGLGSLKGKEDLFVGAGVPRGVDPLGEPLIEDYGFATSDVPVAQTADVETKTRFAENPVLVEQRRAEEERRRRWSSGADNPYMREAEAALSGKSVDALSKGEGDGGGGLSTNLVLLIFVIVLGVASIGTGIAIPDVGFWVGLVAMLLCSLISGVTEIYGIVLAFQTSKDEIWKPIVYLLIAPYRFIYWYQNWSVMKGVVMLTITGAVGITLCMTGFVIAAIQKGIEAQGAEQMNSRSAATARVLEA